MLGRWARCRFGDDEDIAVQLACTELRFSVSAPKDSTKDTDIVKQCDTGKTIRNSCKML